MFTEAAGSLLLENGPQLAAELRSHGLVLSALKASPYFGTFRAEMAALQADLRGLADIVDCIMQVHFLYPAPACL